jgi:membrane-bound lytic murein transglycosylase B
LKPSHDWAQLEAKGAALKPGTGIGAWQSSRLGVIDLLDEPRNLNEYRTGTPNFFAITQYNRSYFYAASVADLAQALAQRMGYGGPN